MSPTMQMTPPSTSYTPTSDAMDRHEYGVNKNRKPASTGGGRAWSDDEEVYLLQTRLQKMPYKHIAAHLKKTELACRLHYHQLSHGSNRRKRTTSVSSGSSNGGHSPILAASIPSPIHEHSPSPSPPGSSSSYGGGSNGVQLPSIMAATGSASAGSSPHLPTILPKPMSMMGFSGYGSSSSNNKNNIREGSPLSHTNGTLLPAPTFTTTSNNTTPPSSAPHSSQTAGTPTLRLDCTGLPPLIPSANGPHHPVDMGRLQNVYAAHRSAFWSTVAADYGQGAHPLVLEQAWRSSNGSNSANANLSSNCGSGMTNNYSRASTPTNHNLHCHQQQQHQTATPLTPGTSPDDRDVFCSVKGSQPQDKTSISAILGIDANPRSAGEREMVRRLEEERVTVAPVA